MIEEKFYPTLADLVDFESLPDNFGVLQQPLTNVVEKISRLATCWIKLGRISNSALDTTEFAVSLN